MKRTTRRRQILLYDTTLRDGTQREGISLSVEDKLRIAKALDALGVHTIEGGWPGSNPKDAEFFRRAAGETWRHARIAAFGSTRRADIRCRDDANLAALLAAETPVVTIVAKGSARHVERILETTREENLRMVAESVSFLKANGKEVVCDLEHFFDGYRADADYSLRVLAAAADAGADCVVLCDTNGGTLPHAVGRIVAAVRRRTGAALGVHTHDDGGVAVANALAAVRAGCTHVQGTINGYGERCGNMDLVPLIANLQLKLGYRCVAPDRLRLLTQVARRVAHIADQPEDDYAPYVGRCSFSHKGGLHAAAVAKHPSSYEHIPPGRVGNRRRIVVSELAGRQSVRLQARALGLSLEGREAAVVRRVKDLESEGYQFETALGSFEMLVRRSCPDYRPPFELLDYHVLAENPGPEPRVRATVKLRVDGAAVLSVAEGVGPVHALDGAIRKALIPRYPALADLRLLDYTVRIVDAHLGTAARPRVLIETARGDERWTTVGCSGDILEASWLALWDSFELPLLRDGTDTEAEEWAPAEDAGEDPIRQAARTGARRVAQG